VGERRDLGQSLVGRARTRGKKSVPEMANGAKSLKAAGHETRTFRNQSIDLLTAVRGRRIRKRVQRHESRLRKTRASEREEGWLNGCVARLH